MKQSTSKSGAKWGKGPKRPRPGVLTAQRKQRAAVKARSGEVCEAEIHIGLAAGRWLWARCRSRGAVAAHIWQRRTCGKARDLPQVVIFTCLAHNADHLHDGRHGVRAPLHLAQNAWDAIIAVRPKETALLGPRPEKGEEIYA